jgi:dipeptidase D
MEVAMGASVLDLKPKAFWRWFAAISQIPRGSHKEDGIRAFLVNFAKERGLECERDKVGNLLVRKAAQGSASGNILMLQAHMDMVWAKSSESDFDFATQGIEFVIDGEWLKANKTTLGADDGFGIAYMLCILDDKALTHPELECVFTVAEEVGLYGATHLELPLKANVMVNLDSSSMDRITVGSAGSSEWELVADYREVPAPKGCQAFTVTVCDLVSGHSGLDIDKNRANAAKLLGRILYTLSRQVPLKLATIVAPGKRNVILIQAQAVVLAADGDVAAFKEAFSSLASAIKIEYEVAEKAMKLELHETPVPANVAEGAFADAFVKALHACPNGPYKFNQHNGAVETSTNIGAVNLHGGKASILSMQRSSSDSSLTDIGLQFVACFQLAGLTVGALGGYNGWQPDFDSKLLELAEQTYLETFHKEPIVECVHAGLEVSLLDKRNAMKKISVGLNVKDNHTPSEAMQISCAEPFERFLHNLVGKL